MGWGGHAQDMINRIKDNRALSMRKWEIYERIKNVTDYVNNGGSLIVSDATALFDANGNQQSRFGLEELGHHSRGGQEDVCEIIGPL